jgi:hypothetical protein
MRMCGRTSPAKVVVLMDGDEMDEDRVCKEDAVEMEME